VFYIHEISKLCSLGVLHRDQLGRLLRTVLTESTAHASIPVLTSVYLLKDHGLNDYNSLY
jgi:hypothetical protein